MSHMENALFNQIGPTYDTNMTATQITVTQSNQDECQLLSHPMPIPSNNLYLHPQYAYPGSTTFEHQFESFSPDEFNLNEVVDNQYLLPGNPCSPSVDEYGYLSASQYSQYSQDEFTPYSTSPMEDFTEFNAIHSNRSVSPYPDSMYYSDRSLSPMPQDSMVYEPMLAPNDDYYVKERRRSISNDRSSEKGRRRRRKHNQIVRKYECDYPDCTKSYGTVTHLNTHRTQKNHGARLTKQDFNEDMG
eukprot:NODE_116_length_19003_cov_0.233707.p8 type:complete len:245 gc:universal NODE_116_length_19003_cov_0.233707:6295-7029(+)